MTFVMLSVCYEVAIRQFMGESTNWVLEINEIVLVYITFLGAAWVLKAGGHVKLDLLIDRLKPKNAAMLNMVTSIIGAIIVLVLLWYGTLTTWDHYVQDIHPPSVMMIPTAYSLVIITVGSLLLLIQFLRNVYGFFKLRGTPPAETGIAPEDMEQAW